MLEGGVVLTAQLLDAINGVGGDTITLRYNDAGTLNSVMQIKVSRFHVPTLSIGQQEFSVKVLRANLLTAIERVGLPVLQINFVGNNYGLFIKAANSKRENYFRVVGVS